MMTDAERSQALECFGYTPRQAHFLTLAALHGGYFLRRHFVQFTGVGHGLATVRFLAKARALDHIRELPYGRHGALFHLCARPVYAALGQEDNRNRRPAEWGAVVRKLMTLDFVLTQSASQFWATEGDKTALLHELDVDPSVWPAKRYHARRASTPITTRHFVDKMPWYREGGDPRLWLAYVNAESTLAGFETYLDQYAGVIAAVPSGVSYVGLGPCRARVESWFAQKYRGITSVPPEFRQFCSMRRCVEARDLRDLSAADIQRFRGLRARFSARSFDVLYRQWEHDGDAALDAAAADRQSCPLRVLELTFRYEP
jgi:hypothetical protein